MEEMKAEKPEIKTVYCHTCDRWFHPLGIMRHRSMHKEKEEDCEITFTNGETYFYEYSKLDTTTGGE